MQHISFTENLCKDCLHPVLILFHHPWIKPVLTMCLSDCKKEINSSKFRKPRTFISSCNSSIFLYTFSLRLSYIKCTIWFLDPFLEKKNALIYVLKLPQTRMPCVSPSCNLILVTWLHIVLWVVGSPYWNNCIDLHFLMTQTATPNNCRMSGIHHF